MKTLYFASAALALVIAAPAFADEGDGPNFAEDARSDEQTGVELIALSGDLYQYGVDNRDPLAVIVAARMRASVQVTDSDHEAEGDVEPGGDGAFISAEDMFEEARILARGDEMIVAMIDDATADDSRGRVGGPGRSSGVLAARGRASYNIAFTGGQRAAVSSAGAGRTDIDMYIYDANGNLICRDINYSDRSFCAWTPRWTGTFRIELRNLGGVSAPYSVVTN